MQLEKPQQTRRLWHKQTDSESKQLPTLQQGVTRRSLVVLVFPVTLLVLLVLFLLRRLNIGRSNLLIRCAVYAGRRLAREQALRRAQQQLLERILVFLYRGRSDGSTADSVCLVVRMMNFNVCLWEAFLMRWSCWMF